MANDSKDIAANVTVVVEVIYYYNGNMRENSKTKRYEGKKMAIAGVDTVIEIPISKTHPENSNFLATSVSAKSISGEKCEK